MVVEIQYKNKKNSKTEPERKMRGSHPKFVTIVFLKDDSQQFHYDDKSTGKDLLERIASSLSIRETYLFGLSQLRDGEHYFIDLNEKISKYAPAKPRGLMAKIEEKEFILYFRVQFYVDNETQIRDNTTRHQYYLQLKKNIVRCFISCSEELCFKLASYALQADFGDITNCTGDYFDPSNYFPTWIIETRSKDFILQGLPNIHRDHMGMHSNKAKLLYIKEVACLLDYGYHSYQLLKKKVDSKPSIWLGIAARGLLIHEIRGKQKYELYRSNWADIGKLTLEKKKVQIRPHSDSKIGELVFFVTDNKKIKDLTDMCKGQRRFQTQLEHYNKGEDEEETAAVAPGDIDIDQKITDAAIHSRISPLTSTSASPPNGLVSSRPTSNAESITNEDNVEDEHEQDGPYREDALEEDDQAGLEPRLYRADRYGPMPSPSEFEDRGSSTALTTSQDQLAQPENTENAYGNQINGDLYDPSQYDENTDHTISQKKLAPVAIQDEFDEDDQQFYDGLASDEIDASQNSTAAVGPELDNAEQNDQYYQDDTIDGGYNQAIDAHHNNELIANNNDQITVLADVHQSTFNNSEVHDVTSSEQSGRTYDANLENEQTNTQIVQQQEQNEDHIGNDENVNLPSAHHELSSAVPHMNGSSSASKGNHNVIQNQFVEIDDSRSANYPIHESATPKQQTNNYGNVAVRSHKKSKEPQSTKLAKGKAATPEKLLKRHKRLLSANNIPMSNLSFACQAEI